MTTAAEQNDRSAGAVLVVDDELQLRRLFARSLTKAGYTVTEARHGREALELVRQHAFDLVLSDVQMPDMNGLDLLEALHAHYPELPVALVSGSFDEAATERAMGLGAVACLSKPVAFEALHELAALAIETNRK